MWLPLLLLVGVVAIVASSTASARGVYGPQLMGPMPLPMLPPAPPPGLPGPISVLGEFVRIGQVPPPPVILCAIAEAEAFGRGDIAEDIVRLFVAPVVYQHQQQYGAGGAQREMLYAPGPMGTVREVPTPRGPSTQLWPPEANYPGLDPRFGAAVRHARGEAPAKLQHTRGSCAPPRSPRDQAARDQIPHARDFHTPSARDFHTPSARDFHTPSARDFHTPSARDFARSAAPIDVLDVRPARHDIRRASDEEIRARLNADPEGFVRDVAAHAHGMLNDPNWSTNPATAHLANRPVTPDEVMSTIAMEAVTAAARDATPIDVAPPPPPPVMSPPAVQPMGLPPEVVAQMQEAAGIPEAADHTRASAIGSPIAGVPDDAWREFTRRLEREALTYQSARHVGCYRQRRERLAELGIDPNRVLGSAEAQRAALDADLANAHHHAAEGGLLGAHLGRRVVIPGRDDAEMITLSGVLGVIQCAGLDNAVGWLEQQGDRKRFPHTTAAFMHTNGVF